METTHYIDYSSTFLSLTSDKQPYAQTTESTIVQLSIHNTDDTHN